MRALLAVLPLLGLSGLALAAPPALSVQLPASAPHAVGGRLLVFAEPAAQALARAKGGVVEEVDASPFSSPDTEAAAMEVARIAPGATVAVDVDRIAFPKPFSQLPPGDYFVQAVLDTAHDDNYAGRGEDDFVSKPVRVTFGANATIPVMPLLPAPAPRTMWTPRPDADEATRAALAQARANTRDLDVVSARLSDFWGRPMHMRGWVVLPPGYDAGSSRYPTVYLTHGFGGTLRGLIGQALSVDGGMRAGRLPPMIWVLLDESSPTGTHEFADSVNNGPWGAALTEELIPELERTYRMDAKPSGRFLTGHSSGGWAALWLQVRYPTVFGGTWPTSPDPSDFHDFTGVDLYAPHANVYHRADGSAYPLVRDKGKVVATFEQFARLENVVGPVGGQMGSFDWVFSPRGPDGRPMPMFDRETGDVDPAVVAYWRDHYDIAQLIRTQWPRLKPDLDGRIHLTVGTADTFYLDGAAHRLQATLDGLGAKSDFRFVPGRTHFDLYAEGDDRMALSRRIAAEMYAVARPGSNWKPATETSSGK